MAQATKFLGPVISFGALGGVEHNPAQEFNLVDCAVQSDANVGSGILGTSSKGFGVVGITGPIQSNALSGNIAGVCGVGFGEVGVRGKSNFHGVLGQSSQWYGVYGTSETSIGVLGSSETGTGVYGASKSAAWFSSGVVGANVDPNGTGVLGWTPGTSSNGVLGMGGLRGLWGMSNNGNGVQGQSNNGSGVFGTSSTAEGVRGVSSTGPGVYGRSTLGKAGIFEGDVQITGTLFKGNVMFKIDHPLDPDNKYLYHSGVESPEMKNIYDGIAELDAKGQAVVELPDWFEALNKDFRYQLTPIGASAPDLHIGKEITGNRFVISGGRPQTRVCWQVTGIRQDAFANAHRMPVEENKPDKERGLFLHPEPFKQSEKKKINLGSQSEAHANAEKEFARVLKELEKAPKLPDSPERKS